MYKVDIHIQDDGGNLGCWFPIILANLQQLVPRMLQMQFELNQPFNSEVKMSVNLFTLHGYGGHLANWFPPSIVL